MLTTGHRHGCYTLQKSVQPYNTSGGQCRPDNHQHRQSGKTEQQTGKQNVRLISLSSTRLFSLVFALLSALPSPFLCPPPSSLLDITGFIGVLCGPQTQPHHHFPKFPGFRHGQRLSRHRLRGSDTTDSSRGSSDVRGSHWIGPDLWSTWGVTHGAKPGTSFASSPAVPTLVYRTARLPWPPRQESQRHYIRSRMYRGAFPTLKPNLTVEGSYIKRPSNPGL